ncbi:MAG TPA: UTP--glucose-1-phosphate uridylyltransferase, partial [bacterium]|nr:UTP--glucose-1-phosphate uridylyltransferase [bacterium]
MRAWSIGEVARLLGVKPHVIRYWESELPLLSPKKGLSGRREYSANEVRLLMRFRHLLYEQKFTIEGAKNRLWEELGSVPPDIAARFAEIRSDLIDALMTSRRTADSAHEVARMPQQESQPQLFPDPVGSVDLRRNLGRIGQGHLFSHWEDRPEAMRRRLMEDLASLDPGHVQALARAVTDAGTPPAAAGGVLEPAPYVALEESRSDASAREEGEQEIHRGTCAFLTVAGGQGSRLGFDGPKGMFPVTPIRRLTLFALFAEKLLAARRRYGAAIPWLVMTGPQNHAATESYFRRMDWFGLGRGTVHLFPQASLPSLSPEGRLVMAPDGGLFFNPNGHGGVVDALRSAGLLENLNGAGVRHLFYFQVDNPLVRVPDPLFLGFHCRAGALVSAKVIAKAYPEEKLGVIVISGGRPAVIEYSDLDQALMQERAADGRLRYLQGSPAIHLLEVPFLQDPRL